MASYFEYMPYIGIAFVRPIIAKHDVITNAEVGYIGLTYCIVIRGGPRRSALLT